MIKILRWVFGVTWIVASIGMMTTNAIVGGILVLVAALLMLPPTFGFITQSTGTTFGRPIKIAAILLPLFAGVGLSTAADNAKAAEDKKLADAKAAEKQKQEQLAYERLSPAAKDSIKRAAALEEKNKKAQEKRAAEYAAKKERREKIESQFSSYDGSHHGVERAIKARMNDPDSYEHVQTRFKDEGSYILVYTQFRGKNAFNAKIMSVASAKVDFSGNVLDLQMK
jgi:UPF0716 family protein affecting phage T7 exclusion